MGLRKHQREMHEVIGDITAGRSAAKEILISATPGGGKSSIPIMAGKLIEAGLADKIAWVVPRSELQDQGERGFMDSFFRDLLVHNMVIRSATNDRDPSRGLSGFVTTYQALGVDRGGRVQEDFERYRYILVIDEYHHVEEESLWRRALQPLIDRCAYLVKMSGTLERGDGKRIAFTNYRQTGPETFEPYLESSSTATVITYSRRDALAEQAILPLHFFLSDGSVAWEEKSGAKKSADSLKKVKKWDNSKALYTALNTGFAMDLLYKGLKHWQKLKWSRNPRSKVLVVTANIADARKYTEVLQAEGITAAIATSHNAKQASANIQKFKGPNLDALVTIAMAYEGMDVPEVTHVITLTNIRSQPWIEQMVARAVRIDKQAGPYETQKAYVFAPHDNAFAEVVHRIQVEQAPFVTEQQGKGRPEESAAAGGGEEPGEFGEGEGEEDDGPVIPIDGKVTGEKELRLGAGTPVVTAQLSLFGEAPVEVGPAPELPPELIRPAGPVPAAPREETPREMEKRLRQEVDRHVGDFCFNNRYEKRKINSELLVQFGKARKDMTLRELEHLQAFIGRVYPVHGRAAVAAPAGISRPRGSGRRVSGKVVPFQPGA